MILFPDSLKKALKKTHSHFSKKLKDIWVGKVDKQRFEELEKLLFESDLGSAVTKELLDFIDFELRRKEVNEKQLKELLKTKLLALFPAPMANIQWQEEGPTVLFLVGTNGSGKTTTVAKLAHFFQSQEKSILIAAADTFRAGACEQLKVWTQQLGCPLITGSINADPSAVIFDALSSAQAKKIDLVLVDTAGRLQTKLHLMEELEKMQRVARKVIATAPHEVIFILDASLGQYGLAAADTFNQFIQLTSIILTKIDSTAKGGVAVNIANKLQIPLSFVGVGEKIEDLAEFHPAKFVDALLQS